MKKTLFAIAALLLLAACSEKKTENTTAADTSATTAAVAVEALTKAGKAAVPGPDTSIKITEEYAKLVARDAYFWAWPLVNMYNRRLAFAGVKDFAMAGPLIQAPLNRFGMLTDYVTPTERAVACPNQDVVYGIGALALDISPVVIQVPDFGDRFWVYQIVDLRTDGFAPLGKMHHTKPGFYLLAGPKWKGDVPAGIIKVFRSSTNTGIVGPRVFMDDTPEDRKAVQPVLRSVLMYPLADFDGKMKTKDWSAVPKLPGGTGGSEEVKWVIPDKFFDELPTVLADAPPQPGEEARYAQVLAVIAAAKKDPKLKAAMIQAAAEVEQQVVTPLFQFRNFGKQLPYHWSTINNGSAWGTDYFTRTAAAKSNILVNVPDETKYFYQDLDQDGGRLTGAGQYTVTFGKGQTPPVNGFWSLTMYNEHHFFEINNLNRYSLGTKNKNLKYNADGSLTIYVQATQPSADRFANWLPSPKGSFTLYIRAYWPKEEVINGSWTPPAVVKIKQ
ncbi:DUF1254 domain-containing protein [Mucilaginibacter sp. AW1-3]